MNVFFKKSMDFSDILENIFEGVVLHYDKTIIHTQVLFIWDGKYRDSA